MSWSEDRLHRWLARRARPRVLSGSAGHDAAVLRAEAGAGRPVICVDQTIEGVHFDAGTPPRKVGAKAAGRALSDLAATAAVPSALTLAISAPPEQEERWMRGAIEGVAARGAELGAELVAGDLSLAPGPARLTVTALGTFPGDGRPPGRDRARAGQVVVLTGPVGGSRAGRHLRIEPRLAAGRWLYEAGATAMMDVSDGLAWDLFRLARASGVAIELENVPLHRDARRAATPDRSARWHALHDGEDHELIATLPRKALAGVCKAAAHECPDLSVIGRVKKGKGLHVLEDGEFVSWDHAGGWGCE